MLGRWRFKQSRGGRHCSRFTNSRIIGVDGLNLTGDYMAPGTKLGVQISIIRKMPYMMIGLILYEDDSYDLTRGLFLSTDKEIKKNRQLHKWIKTLNLDDLDHIKEGIEQGLRT